MSFDTSRRVQTPESKLKQLILSAHRARVISKVRTAKVIATQKLLLKKALSIKAVWAGHLSRKNGAHFSQVELRTVYSLTNC